MAWLQEARFVKVGEINLTMTESSYMILSAILNWLFVRLLYTDFYSN